MLPKNTHFFGGFTIVVSPNQGIQVRQIYNIQYHLSFSGSGSN